MFEDDDFEEVKYVLGMDPGGTTGIALLRYTDSTAPELVYLHQIPDAQRGFFAFFNGAQPQDNLAIASEKWKEGGVKGANHSPLIIEGVQYAIWQDDITYQGPEMKSLVPDAWLKEQNLWTPGKRHQMDALIHAFVWLRNQEHRPTLEALSNRAEKPIAEKGEAENKELNEQDASTGAMTPEEAEELSEAMQELLKAMQEASEAAEEAAEAMKSLAEAMEGDGSEESGQGGSGPADGEPTDADPTGSDPEGGHYIDSDTYAPPEPKVNGKRNKRTRNGVFAGFEVDDAESEGTVLWDEKF